MARERDGWEMSNALSLDEFIEMLECFGADVANWPLEGHELQAVAALLVHSQAARDAVADMRLLEADILAAMPRAPVGLADRILAAAGLSAATEQPIQVLRRPRRPSVH